MIARGPTKAVSRLRLALAAVGAVAVAACDGAERRDAETVLIGVNRFRTADFGTTPAAVDALKATPCTTPEACQTRDVCLAAGEPTAKALRLKAEVEKGLAALERGTLAKDSPQAQELPKKLDEADVLLQKGRSSLPACDEHVQALKRKHRI